MKIRRSVEIDAPRSRVWKALTTPKQFYKWFGCRPLAGAAEVPTFSPGVRMELVSTADSRSDMVFGFEVTELTPEQTMAWKWHPGKVLSAGNRATEPLTTVRFHLEETAGKTVVTVMETGFDLLSVELGIAAFRENDGGWAHQLQQLNAYVKAYSELYAN